MSWQETRTLSPNGFKLALKNLGFSQTGFGRFIGSSDRTIRRMVRGQRDIPTSFVLLLSSMQFHGDKPIVPKRKPGQK